MGRQAGFITPQKTKDKLRLAMLGNKNAKTMRQVPDFITYQLEIGWQLKRCPHIGAGGNKCNGDLFYDGERQYCLQCGFEY